jgi:hypothetical protein
VEAVQEGFGVESLVPANRNKSISFLSNAAKPQCVLVKELQLGRRYQASREFDVTAVNASDFPRAVQGLTLISRPLCPRSETGQVADYGRLRGPVYILQNELSIRERGLFAAPDSRSTLGESPPKNQA